jgi:hypothetical protein
MMTVLIQGQKQPSNDIDVYLRPLVDELLQLWAELGVRRGGYRASLTQLDSTRKYSLINEPARLNSLTKRAPNPNLARLN